MQKLGEDLESCLRQLVFGTVRRSLRKQIAEVMKSYGYLGPYELKILEGIAFVEVLIYHLYIFFYVLAMADSCLNLILHFIVSERGYTLAVVSLEHSMPNKLS